MCSSNKIPVKCNKIDVLNHKGDQRHRNDEQIKNVERTSTERLLVQDNTKRNELHSPHSTDQSLLILGTVILS